MQDALHMMMTRDLVERDVSEEGISYRAGDAAAMFLESLTTPYICALKERAKWLTNRLSDYDEAEFDAMMHEFFDRWIVEFQDIQVASEDSTS